LLREGWRRKRRISVALNISSSTPRGVSIRMGVSEGDAMGAREVREVYNRIVGSEIFRLVKESAPEEVCASRYE
jgi:hypothetical protein